MEGSGNQKVSKGYGSGLLFSHSVDTSSNMLNAKNIKHRYLKPNDCLGQYIENTNLHSLPPNCFGVLVAYTID